MVDFRPLPGSSRVVIFFSSSVLFTVFLSVSLQRRTFESFEIAIDDSLIKLKP